MTKHRLNRQLALWLFLLAFNLPHAQAKLFQNSYISFEMPQNWECNPDGTEYVCISLYAKQAKEAIIILTAKEIGPTDSLDAYETHLKTPRVLTDKSGKSVPSKVLQVTRRNIANHPWVESMHLGSEISSYYTRYLATVKDRIAILITFSAHKSHYTKYSKDFLQSVETLRVVAARDILDKTPSLANQRGQIGVGPGIEPDPTIPDDFPAEPTATSSNLKLKLLALALILGAVGFYLWRRKKK